MLRVCVPALLVQVLQRVGAHLPLDAGLRLIRTPIDPATVAALRRLPVPATSLPLPATLEMNDADLVQQYLERSGRSPRVTPRRRPRCRQACPPRSHTLRTSHLIPLCRAWPNGAGGICTT